VILDTVVFGTMSEPEVASQVDSGAPVSAQILRLILVGERKHIFH
jgi:hypothetical protein